MIKSFIDVSTGELFCLMSFANPLDLDCSLSLRYPKPSWPFMALRYSNI